MSGFRIDISNALQGFSEAEIRTRATIGLYGDTAARKMEAEGKRKASWTDRTSHARQSIEGRSGWQGRKLVIRLSGGMNYSVYLELAHEKKYSILYPTVKKMSAEIIRGMTRVIGG